MRTSKKQQEKTAGGPLHQLAGRELQLSLPNLGPLNPGSAWISMQPETAEDGSGGVLTVIGNNMAGLWFVLAEDGSVHLVDDCERELGTKLFPSLQAFANELARQNGKADPGVIRRKVRERRPRS